jgi:hypothetical protein
MTAFLAIGLAIILSCLTALLITWLVHKVNEHS